MSFWAKEKAEDVCATFSASSMDWICSASERNRFRVSC
ncbi:hypothetical protein EVA_13465 [gut metagenome]|uniref:Uncharacterized protein n=1 Tax=gut metagenome TaxID=749906 RepID=J9FTX8_9ZZZZ